MDLFEYNREQEMKETGPLAYRMRPRSLEEFVGQEEIVERGRSCTERLRRTVSALSSSMGLPEAAKPRWRKLSPIPRDPSSGR
mgnify:CR=1 FL=1